MEYVESEKDIGVVIDNKLTFDQHISEKNKANLIIWESSVELWNTWIAQHLLYYTQPLRGLI
jgi:hypothetical protein